MPLAPTLITVISLLDLHGIPYVVVGSLVSSAYGEPRSTQDIDIVIEPRPEQLRSILGAFTGDKYYVSVEAAQAAFASRGMFNVIDLETGWKIGFIFPRGDDFSKSQFDRRVGKEILAHPMWILTPEDTILSKLQWHAMSQSERQYRDAVTVAATQWEHLDFEYLRHWAKQLKLAAALEEALLDADELRPR